MRTFDGEWIGDEYHSYTYEDGRLVSDVVTMTRDSGSSSSGSSSGSNNGSSSGSSSSSSTNDTTKRNGTANTTFYGTNSADTMVNNAANVTIVSGNGNDSIYNQFGGHVSINAGNGNNTVDVGDYYATVISGSGNDLITLRGSNDLLNSGAGNDSIRVVENYSTMTAGKGDDVITLNQRTNHTIIRYANGDGNDVVYNYISWENPNNPFNDNLTSNMIWITDGSDYSTQRSGSDVIINVGSGSITLKDVDSYFLTGIHIYSAVSNGKGVDDVLAVSIPGGSDDSGGSSSNNSGGSDSGSFPSTLISNSANDTIISGTSYADSINNSGNYVTINGGSGNDTIYNTGNYTKIYDTIGNNFINNYRGDYTTVNSGTGNDTIWNTGSNAKINAGSGNDKIMTFGRNVTIEGGVGRDSITIDNEGQNISISGGADNDYINNVGTNVTITGGTGDDTINLSPYSSSKSIIQYSTGDGNDIIQGYSSTDTIKITSGTYSTQKSGSDTIIKVGNGKMTLKNYSGTLKINGTKATTSTTTTTNAVRIPSNAFTYNGHSYYVYLASNFAQAQSYCESLGGHLAVINNAAENTAIYNYMTRQGYKGAYFGYTDENDEDNWWWINGDTSTYTNWSTNNNEPNGGTSENYAQFDYWGNFVPGSWNDSTFVEDDTPFICEWDTITGSSINTVNSTTMTVTNSTKSPVTAASTVKNINASTRTTAVKITGNSLANSITGGSGNDSINGGAGADTINGGKGNDTLTGGAGNDVFIYASGQGNDVITDYTANQDKIKITGAKISKTSVSGNDVILSVSNGSIRVKNGKGKKLSIYNNATSLTNTVIGSSSGSTSSGGTSSTLLTVTNSTKSPVTVGSAIKTINASSRTTAVKITGNALANSIVGGKGADTLIGGKGNDTLTGGTGANVFVYANGDGNDVITDYKATDKITITGGSYTRSTVGNDVRIKVGTGSITLKNAKGKSVTINNSRAFEERWFLDNSECGMRNDELSSILDNKSSDIVIDSKHDNAANFLQKTLTTLSSNKNN